MALVTPLDVLFIWCICVAIYRKMRAIQGENIRPARHEFSLLRTPFYCKVQMSHGGKFCSGSSVAALTDSSLYEPKYYSETLMIPAPAGTGLVFVGQCTRWVMPYIDMGNTAGRIHKVRSHNTCCSEARQPGERKEMMKRSVGKFINDVTWRIRLRVVWTFHSTTLREVKKCLLFCFI